jgi:hypothetical protein
VRRSLDTFGAVAVTDDPIAFSIFCPACVTGRIGDVICRVLGVLGHVSVVLH